MEGGSSVFSRSCWLVERKSAEQLSHLHVHHQLSYPHMKPSLRACTTLHNSAYRFPVLADLFMKSVWSLSLFSDAQTAVCLPRSHQGPFPAQSGGNKGLTHIHGDERSSPNLALRACLTQNLFVCGPVNGSRLLCKADVLVSVLLKWDTTCH